MKIKKIILGTAVAIVGFPLTVLLIAIVWISVLDRTNGAMVLSGETREYLLHVPNHYDPDKRTPLVISLHAGRHGRLMTPRRNYGAFFREHPLALR